MEKMESGAYQVELKPTQLSAMVQSVVSSMQPWARDAKVALTVVEARGVPTWVMADVDRLSQVLANFMSNALKFVDRTGFGTVEVALFAIETPFASAKNDCEDPVSEAALPAIGCQWLRMQVADNGVGISEQDAAKLWQPFQQIEAGKRQQGQGSGLGLSICKEIVRCHGGTVGLCSFPGNGTTFFADIPFIACGPPLPEAPVPACVRAPMAASADVGLKPRDAAAETVEFRSSASVRPSAAAMYLGGTASSARLVFLIVDDGEYPCGLQAGTCVCDVSTMMRPDGCHCTCLMPHFISCLIALGLQSHATACSSGVHYAISSQLAK